MRLALLAFLVGCNHRLLNDKRRPVRVAFAGDSRRSPVSVVGQRESCHNGCLLATLLGRLRRWRELWRQVDRRIGKDPQP